MLSTLAGLSVEGFPVSLGYYTDSILKFRLVFPPSYPENPPTVQFLTDVFHPLVSQQDGTFNLRTRFNPWKCVFLFVQRM